MDTVIAALAGNIAMGERPLVRTATDTAWRQGFAAALAAMLVGLAAGLLWLWLTSMPVVDMRL